MALGVIGGVGPMATAYFLERVVTMTDAETDQEHLEMLIYNRPSIPDRTAYILGESEESPVPKITESALTLQRQGADSLCILCVTAHTFYDEIVSSVSVPLIHMVRETACTLKDAGIKKAGVLATDGTISGGVFQKELLASGITPVIPSEKEQKIIMHVIYHCVKANRPVDIRGFMQVVASLQKQGAEMIILGCTELSVVKNIFHLGHGYLDVMDVLARKVILDGGKRLKPAYQELIQ
ncbi:MAG: amino acid racemase [Eubacterium sp.]|nr:amino acid racemase [Eubacterium sp.]